MITKKFLTTKEDIVSYYKTALMKNNTSPIIFIIVLLITVSISKVMNMDSEIKILIIIIMPIIAIVAIISSPYSIAKKLFKQNVFFQHDIFIELSEDGMKQDVYNSNSFLKWTDAYKYFESKKIFAVFISEQQAYIIPKRIFTENEIATVSRILRNNITPPKNSRKKKLLIGIGIYIVLFAVITIAMMFLTQRA